METEISPKELDLLASEAGLLLPAYLLEEAQARWLRGESPPAIQAALRAPDDDTGGLRSGRDVPEEPLRAFLERLDKRLRDLPAR